MAEVDGASLQCYNAAGWSMPLRHAAIIPTSNRAQLGSVVLFSQLSDAAVRHKANEGVVYAI